VDKLEHPNMYRFRRIVGLLSVLAIAFFGLGLILARAAELIAQHRDYSFAAFVVVLFSLAYWGARDVDWF
jgi:hypothetical protein